MKTAFPIAIFLALVPSMICAGAPDIDDWTGVRFEPIQGTITEVTIDAVVNGLGRDPDTDYSRNLAAGKHWDCIDAIMAVLVQAEEEMEGVDLSKDPLRYEYILSHSGQPWSFWHEAAAIGRAATDFGHPEILTPEFRDVLDQMEASFVPLLKPAGP